MRTLPGHVMCPSMDIVLHVVYRLNPARSLGEGLLRKFLSAKMQLIYQKILIFLSLMTIIRMNLDIYFSDNIVTDGDHIIQIENTYDFSVSIQHLVKIYTVFHIPMLFFG